jgi:LuxR family transcriptional regulator, regulator of acetate metabolism
VTDAAMEDPAFADADTTDGAGSVDGSEAIAEYAPRAAQLAGLTSLQRRLNSAPTIGVLLARAAVEGSRACGFERGVVLAVSEGRLSPAGMDAVDDPACDELRRRSLTVSIPLTPASEEVEVIRRAEGQRPGRTPTTSLLQEEFALREYALAAIVPESRALALLIVDRADPAVTEEDLGSVELFAHLLSVAVERVVLRLRMSELSTEFRHLTASAHALIKEALEAPVGLTTDYGHGPVFTTAGQETALSGGLTELLSDREREIATLMVRGRSNREIGEELHLSPETIKAHVARLVRKLGASNRVEAVATYVSMARESDL